MQKQESDYKYKYVMLLDDSELDNFINEKMIGISKFSKNVYVNTSSKKALEFLNNLAFTDMFSHELFPEVIFIDLNMPVISGLQFINYLFEMKNENVNNCKLVILTSSIYPDDQKEVNNISKDIIFLNKPLTISALNEL